MAGESQNSACPPDIFFDVRDLSRRSAPAGRAIARERRERAAAAAIPPVSNRLPGRPGPDSSPFRTRNGEGEPI